MDEDFELNFEDGFKKKKEEVGIEPRIIWQL